jgi:hypothetical protein
MTVVEVVVASFILFFVLTAVLGLVGATTQTSISAKQRTAMTNAVASYIEYVRALSFDRVAFPSADNPSGGVQPTVVKRDGAFTITLTNTLGTGMHNTRELSISAICSAEGYPPMRTTAFASIRDKMQSANDLGQPHSGGPIITFGGLTPTENTVVYGANVLSGDTLYVDASAQSTSGVIYTMEFRVGDQQLRNGSSSDSGYAYWTPGTSTTYQSIKWDTRQIRGSTPTPAVMDGWRIVRILATDDLGRQTFKDRRFFVDNDPPNSPGDLTCTPRTDVTTLITWPRAMDGTDPAYRYEMPAYREPADPNAAWNFITTYTLDQPAHNLPTVAFSRYWVWVRALSPRGLASSYTSCGAPFISRPLLSGESSCTITGVHSGTTSTVSVKLVFSQPTFGVTGLRYDLYRGTSETSLTLYRSGIAAPTFSENITTVIGSGAQTPYYYQVRATFTPSGWPYYGGSSPQTISSDIVGPTMTTVGTNVLAASW